MPVRDPVGRVRALVAPWLRQGSRTVVMTSSAIRVGNLLYVWMYCHRRRLAGEDVRALWTPATEGWDELWDLLARGLVMRRESMRPWDRREELPERLYQRFDTDFTADDVQRFAHDVLLVDRFRGLLPTNDALVVNVRRGDYYDNPEFRARYGFDVEGYLRAAWEISCDTGGVPDRVVVVSDDAAWCRHHLAWLADATGSVSYMHEGPQRDLARLASARRLILANSTFSYWGGYLSGVLHPGVAGSVVAPRFHVRDLEDGRAWQLDPRWQLVEGYS